jgi:uncharacterized protein YcfJ
MTKFRNTIGALVLAATAVTGFTATPAMAGGRYDDGYSRYERYDDRYDRGDRYDRYDRREYRRGDRYYQNNRNNYQRCDRGTGGTIIGAVAGGLLGNEVARRGNKTEGSIIGAAVGALAGRAIDKSDSNCNRRYR